MASPLSPLTTVNRAAALLARHRGWFLVTSFCFEILPMEAIQYLTYRPMEALRLSGELSVVAWAWAIWLCLFGLSALHWVVVYRLILDRGEAAAPPAGKSIATGVVRFGRSCWWLLPVHGLAYWLTYYTFFIPGVILSWAFSVFAPYCAVDGHGFGEGWRAAWTMARRHGLGLLYNILCIFGASFIVYRILIPHLYAGLGLLSLELRFLVLLPIGTIFSVVFSAWHIAFYAAIKDCLRDRPQQVAAVFE